MLIILHTFMRAMQGNASSLLRVLVVVVVLVLAGVWGVAGQTSGGRVLYEWTTVEYEWQSEEQKERYLTELLYIPSNNAMAGIKVWKDNIYVTVPRWRPGLSD